MSALSIRIIVFLYLLLQGLVLHAQKENTFWFFGKGVGMTFQNNQAAVFPAGGHAIKDFIYSSSVASDPQTGALLFYTNSVKVFNRLHQPMASGGNGIPSNGVLIVPDLSHPAKYYIFNVDNAGNMYYSGVDMRLNNGLGDVTFRNRLLTTGLDTRFTAVKQLYGNGYWLITHNRDGNLFYVFSISRTGIDPQPVISFGGSATSSAWLNPNWGDMITDTKGTTIGYTPNPNQIEIFSFDKKCGTISLKKAFSSTRAHYSIAFDAELKYLYACSGFGRNVIAQVKVDDAIADITPLMKEPTGMPINKLKLGPDNKIYITTEEILFTGLSPSRYLDVIHSPSQAGNAMNYQAHGVTLWPGPRTVDYLTDRLPSFIFDRTISQDTGYERPKLKAAGFCYGSSTELSIETNGGFTSDSIKWFFGDGDSTKNPFPSKTYAVPGKYTATFCWYLCGRRYSDTIPVVIKELPVFNFGPDTILCPGIQMPLSGPKADRYEWSTGATTDHILVSKPGTYKLRAINGECVYEDEITIGYHQSLWEVLGDEHFICDREKELVKLDAGEGYQSYKWFPTADTTQWIVVGDVGSYFVVMKDFRGCSGSDGTTVKRRCPVSLYFPNAFTPNDDGINDTYQPSGSDVVQYKLHIYNRWGQVVFESSDLSRQWDGKQQGSHCPAGVYYYTASYSGYINKTTIRSYESKGSVSLIR